MMAADASTKPEAGVIATSPATAPAAGPSTLGCPWRIQETVIQVEAAHRGGGVGHHERVCRQAVGRQGAAGVEAEPAEPEQPRAEHRVGQVVRLQRALPKPMRLPSTRAATRADTPAVMWTTVPPAKSSAPRSRSQPPTAQTQCATGS